MAQRWTNRQTGIVLLVIIIGGVLGANWPVWFAPPNTANTFWLYLGLLVIWFPVLIVLTITHHHGSLVAFIFLIVAGIVVGVMEFQGLNFAAWAIEAKDCTSHEVSPGQTEYACRLNLIFAHQIFTLQGPTDSPFVRLVSNVFTTTE